MLVRCAGWSVYNQVVKFSPAHVLNKLLDHSCRIFFSLNSWIVQVYRARFKLLNYFGKPPLLIKHRHTTKLFLYFQELNCLASWSPASLFVKLHLTAGPFSYSIWIFSQLKLCVRRVIHTFKWLKITIITQLCKIMSCHFHWFMPFFLFRNWLHKSHPSIWKGVSATLQSGRYTLSYPRGWNHRISTRVNISATSVRSKIIQVIVSLDFKCLSNTTYTSTAMQRQDISNCSIKKLAVTAVCPLHVTTYKWHYLIISLLCMFSRYIS